MTISSELRQELESFDPEERRRAVAQLSATSDPDSVSLLLRRLGDDNWRVRKEATNVAIARAPEPALLTALIEVLQPGDNIGLRNAAVEALAGFGAHGVEAVGRVVSYLDPDGRKLAAEALAASQQRSAMRILERMLDDDDANVRAAVIDALATVGAENKDGVTQLMVRALDTADGYQRLVALEGINRLGLTIEWSVLEPLLDEPLLNGAALLSAGRSGHTQVAPYIVEALRAGPGFTFSSGLAALAELITSSQTGLAAGKKAMVSAPDEVVMRCFTVAQSPTESLDDQANALLVLGAVGGDQAVQAALNALNDERLAGHADQALMMLGSEAIPVLGRLIEMGDLDQRAVGLELLGRLCDEANRDQVLDLVRSSTRDDSVNVVRAALGVLTRIGGPETLEDASESYTAEADGSVRAAARGALLACAKRFPAEARRFVQGVDPQSPEAAAAAVVLSVITPNSSEESSAQIEFLAEALSNSSQLVRRAALDALATRRAASAVDAIAFAVGDEAAEVRNAALLALGRIRGEDGNAIAVERLLGLLDANKDDSMQVSIIEALGETQDARAVSVLSRLVESPDARSAVAAVEALGTIGTPGPWTETALKHPEPEVAKATLRVLSDVPGPDVISHLTRCLEHEAWDVRRLAADLLGQVRGAEAQAALRARDRRETEPLVREAIRRSLAAPGEDGGSKE